MGRVDRSGGRRGANRYCGRDLPRPSLQRCVDTRTIAHGRGYRHGGSGRRIALSTAHADDRGNHGLLHVVQELGPGEVHEEVEAVAEMLGKHVNVTGFYSNGEISGDKFLGECHLHNQTMTISYIFES